MGSTLSGLVINPWLALNQFLFPWVTKFYYYIKYLYEKKSLKRTQTTSVIQRINNIAGLQAFAMHGKQI